MSNEDRTQSLSDAASSAGAQTSVRRLSQRIGSIAESATLAVDSKAKALKAEGHPVIGFGAGEPDFPTPAHIVEAAVEAVRDPKNHRYSATAGLPVLRQAIAETTARTDSYTPELNQILVTNGGKQAVYQAFATLLDPGDEVILPAPYWTTYPESIRLAGGIEVPVVAGAEQNYIPTIEQLDAAVTDKTRAVVLCSPSNPTGAVMSRQQLEEFAAWALKRELWVVSDEIYQNLIYGEASFTSILEVAPELADRTLLLNGVAKTFAMTGWRVGWMIGPADVIKAATNLQSHLSSHVNNVAQQAAAAALTGPQEPIEDMRRAFDRRRQEIVRRLSEIEGFRVPTPEGAFYAYPDVTAWIGRELKGQTITSSSDLASAILDHAEVAVVPGEAFGTPGYLRFSYALADDELAEGIDRIARLLSGE